MPESSDKGGRKPRVTDEDLLDVFRDAADPVLSTAEVADAVPIKRRGTLNRLRGLEDAGDLESKQIGGRNTVWWLAGDHAGGVDIDGHETGESGGIVDVVAEEWDDTDDRLEARKEAARAVLAYAREHGTVSKKEAKEKIRPEYPVENQNARTWYRRTVKPVLKEAAEYDNSARAYRIQEDADVYDPTEEF